MRKSDKIKNIEEANKRLLQEGSGPNGLVSFDVMRHKLIMGKELGEPDLSQMVDEVIKDLGEYLKLNSTDSIDW